MKELVRTEAIPGSRARAHPARWGGHVSTLEWHRRARVRAHRSRSRRRSILVRSGTGARTSAGRGESRSVGEQVGGRPCLLPQTGHRTARTIPRAQSGSDQSSRLDRSAPSEDERLAEASKKVPAPRHRLGPGCRRGLRSKCSPCNAGTLPDGLRNNSAAKHREPVRAPKCPNAAERHSSRHRGSIAPAGAPSATMLTRERHEASNMMRRCPRRSEACSRLRFRRTGRVDA